MRSPGGFRSTVLCYHAVAEAWDDVLAIPLARLERQVRVFLLRGLRPATAAETIEGTGRLLHVTFDDAFRNVERALPVLERLGVPVTVFACTGYADDGRPFDVPELTERRRGFEKDLETMDWDGLGALAERGVEVGSHTVSHPHLPLLTDDELDRELMDSRARLEDQLKRPCRYLAYPFGDEDGRVRAAARAAGYEAAFALPGDTAEVDRFAVPRVWISRDDGVARALLKTSPLIRRCVAALRRGTEPD